MKRRLVLTSIALIAICLAWLVPFTEILIYGTHTVQEPSLVILCSELALFVALIMFSISNIFYND